MEVPMPDNVSEQDALKQRKTRLLTRVKSMMSILEMEFGAVPEEIITTVVMALNNEDSEELGEMLNSTLDIMKFLIPIKSVRKPRRR
jgi:hypothetical protein